MKLQNVKQSINNSIKEVQEVSLALERGNTNIDKNDFLERFNNLNLEIDGEDLIIKEELKEYINNNCDSGIRETKSLLYSLISIVDEKKDKRNHLLSLEIEDNKVKNYYLNTMYLEEELDLSKLFLNHLKDANNLDDILDDLFMLFYNKTDSYYKKRFEGEDFHKNSILYKIDTLKDVFTTVYGDSKEIDRQYYLFYSDDINIKTSLGKYYENKKNLLEINQLTYSIFNSAFDGKYDPLKNSFITFQNEEESLSQRFCMEELNKQVNIVIGAGGSGKTHLASNIGKEYLYLSAVGMLGGVDVNLLYTTYSKYSLKQFLIYSEKFNDLIYQKDKEVIKNRIADFEENIDMEKLNNIKKKLLLDTSIRNNFLNMLKIDLENEATFMKYYKHSLDINTFNSIAEYMRFVKNKKHTYSFIQTLKIALGMMKKEGIDIPSRILKKLYAYDIKVFSKIEADNIDKYMIFLQKKYLENHQKANDAFGAVNKSLRAKNYTTYNFEQRDISIEDLIYFLRFYPVSKITEKKDFYIKEMQKFLKDEVNNVDSFVVAKLFPITAGLTTDIVDINHKFAQTLIDESVLVPAYFLPAITNKSNNITIFGDLNQLTLEQNFNPNIKNIISTVYNNNKGLKLSVDAAYRSKSVFDHLKVMVKKEDIIVLTDNYRSNSKIYNLAKLIGGDEYQSYFSHYINKHKEKLDAEYTIDTITKHYKDNEKDFIYKNEREKVDTFNTPFLFADSKDEDRYDKIFTLLSQNRINSHDVLVVVSFKSDIKRIKKLFKYKNYNVIVDIIENVQGIEKKVVIFDWNVNSVLDEEFRYLETKKFNLILTRAKEMFITIADFDFIFEEEIANYNTEGYKIIYDFIRNDKIKKYKINGR